MMITVDVDEDDVIKQLDDEDLIEELEARGYCVEKGDGDPAVLDRYDWQKIGDILLSMPYHWEIEELRKKVMKASIAR